MQISKLDGMEARYMALEDQLSDPSVIADQRALEGACGAGRDRFQV